MKNIEWLNIPGLKVLSFLIILFLYSCTEKEDFHNSPYGEKFNEERRRIGLSQLRADWIALPKNDYNRIWWMAESVDSLWIKENAYYAAKSLLISDGVLISETDHYTNPEVFTIDSFDKKRCMNVYLLYTYNFVDYEDFEKGWDYYLNAEPIKGNLRGYISKSQADSILHSWGLKHPS